MGDLLAGANTVVLRFSTPGGAVDLTGTVTAAVTTALSPTAATALPVLQAGGFTGERDQPVRDPDRSDLPGDGRRHGYRDDHGQRELDPHRSGRAGGCAR